MKQKLFFFNYWEKIKNILIIYKKINSKQKAVKNIKKIFLWNDVNITILIIQIRLQKTFIFQRYFSSLSYFILVKNDIISNIHKNNKKQNNINFFKIGSQDYNSKIYYSIFSLSKT